MSTEYEEAVTERVQVYRALGQGLRVFHEDTRPEVDIVVVPGLGANPEECWTWNPTRQNRKEEIGRSRQARASANLNAPATSHRSTDHRRQFNWIRDQDGLASLFKASRIMLYDFASAWRGPRKVRASMKGICTWLLDDLKEKRKGGTEISRPLIFIGHSLGGIVIAKTLCIAKARREFEAIVTCTVGCIFFGAPFRGSGMAKIALQYSSIFGKDAYESLLSFVKAEKNDTLDEVRDDFMEISSKLEPPIDVVCVYEQVATHVAYAEKIAFQLPTLLQHDFFKSGARGLLEFGLSALNAGTHFVDMESATLPGTFHIGMTADHRDLVKFESVTCNKFLPVKNALTRMVQMSNINVRRRTHSSGQGLLTHRSINQIRQALEGIDMRQQFRAKIKHHAPSSWLTSEPRYQDWLANGGMAGSSCSYMWLKGGPGLGKTNASLAVIHHLDRIQHENTPIQGQSLLAYFLCEDSAGSCTAEDLLKSFVTQIINQEESLAHHARWFAPNPRYPGPASDDSGPMDGGINISGAKATMTMDNLWKCLQDMIDDPAVNRVHFIISNMHWLKADDSTNALLEKLADNAVSSDALPLADRKVKWLVTSRKDKHLSGRLTGRSISAIDLEDSDEYGGKVRAARQNYARSAVSQLGKAKGWSSDLGYYIRSSIESRSEDERWIDVLCVLLRTKPVSGGGLSLREWLREVGDFNLHGLVDHAWHTILDRNKGMRLELEELVQALAIAYEAPSLADLAVLTQISDPKRLSELIQKCSPIIQLGDSEGGDDKVIFANPQFNERLAGVFFDDASRKKRFHGLMALRCFKYIKFPGASDAQVLKVGSLARSKSTTARLVDDARIIDLTNVDELDGTEEISVRASRFTCSYPIKYLFRHLSEGFPDVAQELCDDDPDFWGLESRLRDEWLKDYQDLTTDLKDMNAGGMSALHVAAGMGATELVSVLVNRNRRDALFWMSDDGMTALHVAALNNRLNVVDQLIRADADVDAGNDGIGTALHFAALHGNYAIMKFLIDRGASVNALSETIGPVINAAIRSGTVDAVNLIMKGDVRFDLDYTMYHPPLSLAAGILEPIVFRDILDSGREKWLQNVKLLDHALIEAAIGGRLESVRILLEFQRTNKAQCVYTNDTIERAILQAAEQKHWASVEKLLDYAVEDTAEGIRRGVSLEAVFFLAATRKEDRLDIIEKIWGFTNGNISQDVLDYSLYQAVVMEKDTIALWLLETCGASANACAERPDMIMPGYAATASLTNSWNVLNAAATTGDPHVLKVLLEKGAEINTEHGYALQLAASEGHTEAVRVLLENGAEVNKVMEDDENLGFYSCTALQAACDHGRTDVVATLIEFHADPNLGGGASTNPITAATQKAQTEILTLLLNAPDLNVNVIGGDDGATPLINAAAHMSLESVRLLVEKGADINALNSAGDTALIMAASKGKESCVDMLCKAGADVTYRSPNRGLAIQVAAEASKPLCAHVLAEQMSGTIADYRTKVANDEIVSKDRLDKAQSEIEEQKRTIERLEAFLTETEERMEIATKEVSKLHHEKERLQSDNSFRGATYEAGSQRLKAMENERAELLKQVDSYKGQFELANDTVTQLQTWLDTEKQTNAALRKRQGYATLQQEKKDALELYESACRDKEAADRARAATEESLALEQQNVADLHSDVDLLRSKLQQSEADVAATLRLADATKAMAAKAQAEKAELQKSVRVLKETARGAEERLAAVHAATVADVVNGDAPRAVRRKAVHPTTSPNPNPPSPGIPADGRRGSGSGWQSIHGRHRPDGSLGGYKNGRPGLTKRYTSEGSGFASSTVMTPPGANGHGERVNGGPREEGEEEEENLYESSLRGRSSGSTVVE